MICYYMSGMFVDLKKQANTNRKVIECKTAYKIRLQKHIEIEWGDHRAMIGKTQGYNREKEDKSSLFPPNIGQ